MSKKIFVAVLAVALLGAAVGVGIHILHRDARAEDIQFTCDLRDNLGFPVNSGDYFLDIHLLDGNYDFVLGAAFEFVSETAGYAVIIQDDPTNAVYWSVSIEFGPTPVVPPDNPCPAMEIAETHHLEWIVQVN